MPRGHRRTDATPADATQTFTRKTVDGDVFAQAFVSKTVDGVIVGRVFGTKTVDGDLMIGEVALLSASRSLAASRLVSGKALEPVAFSGKLTVRRAGHVQPQADDHGGRHLRPQDHDRRAAGVRPQGGDEHLTNFASAAVVLPAPRHDR